MTRITFNTAEARSNTAEIGGTVLTSEYGVYEFNDNSPESGAVTEIKLKSSSSDEHSRPGFPAGLYFFFSEIIQFFKLSRTLRHKHFNYDECSDAEISLILKTSGNSPECSVTLRTSSSGETEADVVLSDFECISAEGRVTADEELHKRRLRQNDAYGRLILASALPVFLLMFFAVASKLIFLSAAAFLISFFSSAVYFARKNLNEVFRKRFSTESSDIKITVIDM